MIQRKGWKYSNTRKEYTYKGIIMLPVFTEQRLTPWKYPIYLKTSDLELLDMMKIVEQEHKQWLYFAKIKGSMGGYKPVSGVYT